MSMKRNTRSSGKIPEPELKSTKNENAPLMQRNANGVNTVNKAAADEKKTTVKSVASSNKRSNTAAHIDKENAGLKNQAKEDSTQAAASTSDKPTKAKKQRTTGTKVAKDVGPIRGPDADYSSFKLTKICPGKKKSTVQKLLEQMKPGLSARGEGDCTKEAIRKGFLNIAGTPDDLNKLVFKDVNVTDYGDCDCSVDVTLQMLLEHPNYVGCGGPEGVVPASIKCLEHDVGNALTGMCEGNVEWESSGSGKYLNHCTQGKCYQGTFGECIGDYRDAHCEACDRHYFPKCPCGKSGESSDSDW